MVRCRRALPCVDIGPQHRHRFTRRRPPSPRSGPRSPPPDVTPSKRSISWMPVGEVTLISVSQSPITSMPTKISPCSRKVGPMRGADLPVARGQRRTSPAGRRHACWTAPRLSAGTRLIAPIGSPSTRMMRLSPLPHRRLVALEHQRLARAGEMHLQQRGQVLVVRLDAEHAGAAVAEQRLDDDVLVLHAEGADRLAGPR